MWMRARAKTRETRTSAEGDCQHEGEGGDSHNDKGNSAQERQHRRQRPEKRGKIRVQLNNTEKGTAEDKVKETDTEKLHS